MYQLEFGTKRTCAACAVRFYDLARSPAVCPKCAAVQPPLPARTAAARPVRVRWSDRPVREDAVLPVSDVAEIEETEDIEEDKDDADDVPPEDDPDDDTEVLTPKPEE